MIAVTAMTPASDTTAHHVLPTPVVVGCTRLHDWGVLSATGDDAAAFLHGQLTQDVLSLRDDEARLAAYCNPKGRMLMAGLALRAEGGVLLCTLRERIAPMLKRLSMFVLRAKVRLADASDQWDIWGVAGPSVPGTLSTEWWRLWRDADRAWVRLPPGAGVERALLIQPAGAPAPAGGTLPLEHWRWLDVMSGVAQVSDAVAEGFVPQMLNYESVGGVNFKKGCYPGQEVVARSQFRGTLKRRGHLAHADGPLAAGQEVFHPSDPEQPVGVIAQAAPNPQAGWDAIVALQTSAVDGQPLRAGSMDGPALHLRPLPYELRQDI